MGEIAGATPLGGCGTNSEEGGEGTYPDTEAPASKTDDMIAIPPLRFLKNFIA